MQQKFNITLSNTHQIHTIQRFLDLLKMREESSDDLLKEGQILSDADKVNIEILSVSENASIQIVITQHSKTLYETSLEGDGSYLYTLLLEMVNLAQDAPSEMDNYWKLMFVLKKVQPKIFTEFREAWLSRLWNYSSAVDFKSIFFNQGDFWNKQVIQIISQIEKLPVHLQEKLESKNSWEQLDVLYRYYYPSKNSLEEITEQLSLLRVDEMTGLVHLFSKLNLGNNEANLSMDSSSKVSIENFKDLITFLEFLLKGKIHYSLLTHENDSERQFQEKLTLFFLFALYIENPNLPSLPKQFETRNLQIGYGWMGALFTLLGSYKDNEAPVGDFIPHQCLQWLRSLEGFNRSISSISPGSFFYHQGILVMGDKSEESPFQFICLYQSEENHIWIFLERINTLIKSLPSEAWKYILFPLLFTREFHPNVEVKLVEQLQIYLHSYLNAHNWVEAESALDKFLDVIMTLFYAIDPSFMDELSSGLKSLSSNPSNSNLYVVNHSDQYDDKFIYTLKGEQDYKATSRLDRLLKNMGVQRGSSTTLDNHCLIDAICQFVNFELKEKNYPFSIDFSLVLNWSCRIKKELGKSSDATLSINENPEAVQIITLLQKFLEEKGIQMNFTLTLYLADSQGNLGRVDNDTEISKTFFSYPSSNYWTNLALMTINYNHYQALFPINGPKLQKRQHSDIESSDDISNKKSMKSNFYINQNAFTFAFYKTVVENQNVQNNDKATEIKHISPGISK